MAQNGWDEIYNQTATTSASWEVLTGSSTGTKLGDGTATPKYYYVKSNGVSFTNDNGSGLTINGTVYLYLPAGISITCKGSNADGATGAGAGIELPEGSNLYLIGGGDGTTVTAIGGNAANGGNGGNGNDAECTYDKSILGGSGGTGGHGGGGAGAGIGTRGATGGSGGSGGQRNGSYGQETTQYGVDGSAGSAGSTADAMGKLYVDQTYNINVVATGGSAGSNGTGGSRGKTASQHPGSVVYMASGGGGGGAGGFGGAASNIGTGGPGGGGGGGGAAGNVAWVVYTSTSNGYYHAGAYGGKGGQNANGSYAPDGAAVELDNPKHADIQGGGLRDKDTDYDDDDGWENGNGRHDGGSGAGCGSASSGGNANTGTKTYNISFNPVKSNINGKTGDALKSLTMTYTPSSGTTVILPRNVEGYQWALVVFGKDCAPDGTPANEAFTTATKKFFGGNFEDESYRTINLRNVYGDIALQEVASTCVLENMADNKEVLQDFFYNEGVNAHRYPITVRLKDRTLYKDNHWNTICLPFDLTKEQYSASPLAGATIMRMDDFYTGYYPSGGNNDAVNFHSTKPTLFFYFVDAQPNVNGLQRGKPYLVKWTTGANLVDNTTDVAEAKIDKLSDPTVEVPEEVHQLDFPNVLVQEKTAGSWYGNGASQGGITFQGTFSINGETDLTAGDKTKLVLGANDNLYYPSTTIHMGACRGYFVVPEGTAQAAEIVLSFDEGNGETTSIKMVNSSWSTAQGSDTYYNLNGQRLNAPQKGINIVNGKKILVK